MAFRLAALLSGAGVLFEYVGVCPLLREFPKIRGTLFWGP